MEAAWWAHSLPGLSVLSLSLFLVPSHSRHFVLFLLLFSGLSPSLPHRSPRHPSPLSPSVVPPNRYLLFLSSSNAFHLVAPCPASLLSSSLSLSLPLSLFETPAGTLFLSCHEGSPILSSSCCVSLRLPILFLCLSLCLFLRLSSSLFPYDCIFNLGRLSFLDLGLASPRYYFFLFLSPLGVSLIPASLPFSNLSSLYFSSCPMGISFPIVFPRFSFAHLVSVLAKIQSSLRSPL